MFKKLRHAAAIGLIWRLLGSMLLLSIAWMSWALFQLFLSGFSPAAAAGLTGLGVLLMTILGVLLLQHQPQSKPSSSLERNAQLLNDVIPHLLKVSGRQVMAAKVSKLAREHAKPVLLIAIVGGLLLALGPKLSRDVQAAMEEDENTDP